MNLETYQNLVRQHNGQLIPPDLSLHYLSGLTELNNGWELCIETLVSEKINEEHAAFMGFKVIEEYIRKRYPIADQNEQLKIRNFISRWIMYQVRKTSEEKISLKNKMAQLVCLVFVVDYPKRWPTFFSDLLGTLTYGHIAIENYLRILLAINEQVVEKEIPHTPQVHERNTIIKDTIREQCVTQLVDSWLEILVNHENLSSSSIRLCLEVIGTYISWIDIHLIANDNFTKYLLQFMSNTITKKAACRCLCGIVNKGMDPCSKMKLIESFFKVLTNAGVFENLKEEDDECSESLAELINQMGITLIESYPKIMKSGNIQLIAEARESIRTKINLLLFFLNSEDEDTSTAVVPFAKDYISFLKQEAKGGAYEPLEKSHTQNLLQIVFMRYKYDDQYNFESVGEDEATFDIYRSSFKQMYDSLYQLDTELAFSQTIDMIEKAFNSWRQLPFQEVEVAMAFLLILRDLDITREKDMHPNREKVREMLKLLITSGIVHYNHISITKLFFEIVVKCEFFNQDSNLMHEILAAFLDGRGLNNPSCAIRSQVCYLFSKFIYMQRSHLSNDVLIILQQIQPMLGLNALNSLITSEDQLYLYESATFLIFARQTGAGSKGSSNEHTQEVQLRLKQLIWPAIIEFQSLLEKLSQVGNEDKIKIIEMMCQIIKIISRTTKVFHLQFTMKSMECEDIYTQALNIFLPCFEYVNPEEQASLRQAIRHLLHRIIICVDSLDFIMGVMEYLLKDYKVSSVQDYLSPLTQLINKYKKDTIPYLTKLFKPLVYSFINFFNLPVEAEDIHAIKERESLQRTYFTFIYTLLSANISEVILEQGEPLIMQVLNSVIQGAVEISDPTIQKINFSILKKIIELWGISLGRSAEFWQFVYGRILPACFIAPSCSHFDFADAQTVLVVHEITACIRAIYEKRGDDFIVFLQTQFLPQNNLPPQLIQDYCNNLITNPKTFKKFNKEFLQKIKS